MGRLKWGVSAFCAFLQVFVINSKMGFAQVGVTPFALPSQWLSVSPGDFFNNPAVGDLNGDSKPDLILPRPGSMFPGNNFLFQYGIMGHQGRVLSSSLFYSSQSFFGPNSWIQGATAAVAVANIDGDMLSDVVTYNTPGYIYYLRNKGQTTRDSGFSDPFVRPQIVGGIPNPPILVDNFSASFGMVVGQPFPSPLLIEDFDGDGILDLLQASNIAVVLFGNSAFAPNSLRLYRGRGPSSSSNPFLPPLVAPLVVSVLNPTPTQIPVGVIDAEWVDFDQDGQKETVILLEQTVNLGVYSYYIDGFRVVNGALVKAPGFNQAIEISAAHRPTGMAIGRFTGRLHLEYAFSYTQGSFANEDSGIWMVEADSRGVPQLATAGNLPVPAFLGSDEIHGIQCADFNQDGMVDLVGLRAYGEGASDPNAEVIYGEGPVALSGLNSYSFSAYSVLDLGKRFSTANANSNGYSHMNYAYPNALRVVEMGVGHPTLMVSGLIGNGSAAGSAPRYAGYLVNLTPTALQHPEMSWVEPQNLRNQSGDIGRIGNAGGAPRIGTTGFKITDNELSGNPGIAALIAGDSVISVPYPFPGGTFDLLVPPWGSSHLHLIPPHLRGQFQLVQDISIPAGLSPGYPVYFQWIYFDSIQNSFMGSDALKVVPGN